MSGATHRKGETIVTQDFDEVHFTGDELNAIDKGHDGRRFFALDVTAAFANYNDAREGFSGKHHGTLPESFTEGGYSTHRSGNNPMRTGLADVQQRMDKLTDIIAEGITDGRDITGTIAMIENIARFSGGDVLGNNQVFKNVMRSLISRLEAEVETKGGSLGELRASHEAIEIRTDFWGKVMSAVKTFFDKLSPEQELDAMKSWTKVLAEEVSDLRVRHAIRAAEGQAEEVPSFGVREMAIEAAEIA